MKDPHLIIKKILRTEKGAYLTERQNQYFFEVAMSANKIEIRRAVETLYSVKVQAVNTVVAPRKPKLLRRNPGFSSERKKAIVKLSKDHKIDLTV